VCNGHKRATFDKCYDAHVNHCKITCAVYTVVHWFVNLHVSLHCWQQDQLKSYNKQADTQQPMSSTGFFCFWSNFSVIYYY